MGLVTEESATWCKRGRIRPINKMSLCGTHSHLEETVGDLCVSQVLKEAEAFSFYSIGICKQEDMHTSSEWFGISAI